MPQTIQQATRDKILTKVGQATENLNVHDSADRLALKTLAEIYALTTGAPVRLTEKA